MCDRPIRFFFFLRPTPNPVAILRRRSIEFWFWEKKKKTVNRVSANTHFMVLRAKFYGRQEEPSFISNLTTYTVPFGFSWKIHYYYAPKSVATRATIFKCLYSNQLLFLDSFCSSSEITFSEHCSNFIVRLYEYFVKEFLFCIFWHFCLLLLGANGYFSRRVIALKELSLKTFCAFILHWSHYVGTICVYI